MKGMHFKVTTKCPVTTTETASTSARTVGQDGEKLEPLRIADGDVKRGTCSKQQFGSFLS